MKKRDYIDKQINPSFKLGFERGKLSERKRILKILDNFFPTKSNMMYDDVIEQLQKEIGEEKGK